MALIALCLLHYGRKVLAELFAVESWLAVKAEYLNGTTPFLCPRPETGKVYRLAER